jgi:hypothetical protein
MLRITVHEQPRTVTFQLEGSLADSWLQVLEECWQETLARQSKPLVRIDLTGSRSSTRWAVRLLRPCTAKELNSSLPTA